LDRGTHSIIKNTITNNEAADSGGGLYIDDAEYGSLSTNDIADNTPDEVCIVRTDD
jgi:parallel beta-helix repeat protein